MQWHIKYLNDDLNAYANAYQINHEYMCAKWNDHTTIAFS